MERHIVLTTRFWGVVPSVESDYQKCFKVLNARKGSVRNVGRVLWCSLICHPPEDYGANNELPKSKKDLRSLQQTNDKLLRKL